LSIKIRTQHALKTEHSFLQQDIETHNSYQHNNFHTTGVNALKHAQICLYYDQSCLAPFKSHSKIILGTSWPNHIQ